MFIIANKICLLSSKLFTSRAKDDIVVKEPQKPIANKNEYLASRFHDNDNTENIPKIKLPIIFTIEKSLINKIMNVITIIKWIKLYSKLNL